MLWCLIYDKSLYDDIVSLIFQGSPGYPSQNQHLQLHQNIGGPYRAGSLPNVNQMVGNSGIDLQVGIDVCVSDSL